MGSSNPNYVRLLEPKKSEMSGQVPVVEVRGFNKGVYSIHVDANSRYVAAGCGDRYVSVMNLIAEDEGMHALNEKK